MAVDDSFTKPGAVPFKWEIRPGVPKVQQPPQKQQKARPKQPPPPLPPPASPFINQLSLLTSPPPGPPPPRQPKLKPPPPGSILLLTPEPRTHSFRSAPRSRSERWRFDQPTRLRPDCVEPGCFPSPLLRRKGSKKITRKPEPDYVSDHETLSRRSVSSRRSLSSFYGSPALSCSSFRSSPQLASDAEWAGFGLF